MVSYNKKGHKLAGWKLVLKTKNKSFRNGYYPAMRLGISSLLVTMYGLGGIQIGSMQSNVFVSQGLWYELYKSNTPQGHISKGSPASYIHAINTILNHFHETKLCLLPQPNDVMNWFIFEWIMLDFMEIGIQISIMAIHHKRFHWISSSKVCW